MFVIAFTSVPIVGVANASIADLSSQFVGYNIVNGTVVNGVYLRGAPYFSDSNCPVYFYKINGNNIYISPGKTVYVLERENDYFYIAYQYNGTYYCGYVPVGDISCSGYSWSNFDTMWPGLYVIPEGKPRIQNVCYGPGDATYFLRWSTVDVDHTTSTLLFKHTNRYGFIQHMIDDGGVLKYVRGWVWGNYITPWGNYREETFVPYFYFKDQIKSYDDIYKDNQDSAVYIINGYSKQALTVSSVADGTILTAETFNGSPEQEFCFVRTGNNPVTYKLYSQFAKKFVELDSDTSNWSYARVKDVISKSTRAEFATIPWSVNYPDSLNMLLGVRSSGFYNLLSIDGNNRIIMNRRLPNPMNDWQICPKYWDGSMYYCYSDVSQNKTVKYKVSDSVPNAAVRRAFEYWNICAGKNSTDSISDYEFKLEHDSNETKFIIKMVDAKQAQDDLFSDAYAYALPYDKNGISLIDNANVNYRDWQRVELCIVKPKVESLTNDELVKVIAHEIGHCLKMPHTAVDERVESMLNIEDFYFFPDFNLNYSSTSGNKIAEYDRFRLAKKQY